MAEVIVEAKERTATGKSAMRALRRGGHVPAIYYQAHQDNVLLTLDAHNLLARLAHESGVVTVKTPTRNLQGLVRELQIDPVSGDLLHIDFMGVDLTKRVTAEVEIRLIGTAVGVKQAGGIQDQQLRTLEVQCLPLDIPEVIEVDVSALEIGQSVHVSEVSLDKVEILTPGTYTITSVVPPTVEKVKVEEEAAVPVEGEEVPAEGADAAAPAPGAEKGAPADPKQKP